MADTLPPPARRRLGLILARLASDHEGEIINAARLVCKLLAEHGIRPEAMAGYIGEEPRPQPKPEPRPKPETRARGGFNTGPQGYGWPPPDDDADAISDAADFAEQLLADPFAMQVLSAADVRFCRDLIDRDFTRPATPKQAAWLRDIDEKLRRWRRRA